MKISEYIEQIINSQGRTKIWLAEQLDLKKQDLNYRFKKDSFSAEELIKIGIILNINLEDLKNKYKEEM